MIPTTIQQLASIPKPELLAHGLIFLAFYTLFFNDLFGFEGALAGLLLYAITLKFTHYKHSRIEFRPHEKAVMGAIGFYLVMLIASNLINANDPERIYELANKYSKVLYFIGLVFILKLIRFDLPKFEAFIQVMAYAILITLAIEVALHGLSSHLGSIFSNKGTGAWFFSSVMFATIFLGIEKHTQNSSHALHYAVLSLLLLLVIILTSTRSIWLSSFITLIILMPLAIKHYSLLNFLTPKKLFFVFTMVIIVLTLTHNKLWPRFEQAASDIEKMAEGEYYSSLGLRVVMYKISLEGFTQNSISGIGEANYPQAMQNIYQSKREEPNAHVYRKIAQFKQPHNQFLMEAWTKGILGLLAIVLMFLVPLKLFAHMLKDPRIKVIALTGIAFLINSFVFFLFGAVLTYSHGIVFFMLWLILLIFTANNTQPASKH
ncbi:hypothetical protein AVO41_04395 [Thiomicrospira sp. WB1]|nr:hypothetical protein AVO41_04395 [Thiomicrospira sp. WB1]